MPRPLSYYYNSPPRLPCVLEPPLRSINPLFFLPHLNSQRVKKITRIVKKIYYYCLVLYKFSIEFIV